MRSYCLNSSQAGARILALALGTDGLIHGSESVVINAASGHCGLHRHMFTLYTP